MISIEQLGQKICVIGPVASGKSTLAACLADKIHVKPIHLDQLAFLPNSNWKRRDSDSFLALHNEAIKQDGWVIDGNYSISLSQRLLTATSVVWLDLPLILCLKRYILRSLPIHKRYGKLDGASNEFSFWLAKHLITECPKNRNKYEQLLSKTNIPIVHIRSAHALKHYFSYWQLNR